MKKTLADIQDGTFAREWIKENKDGGYHFAELREKEQQHPIEIVGAQLRGMMSWLPGRRTAKKPSGSAEADAEPPDEAGGECLREPKSFCGACAPKGWTWCLGIPVARSCRCMTRWKAAASGMC